MSVSPILSSTRSSTDSLAVEACGLKAVGEKPVLGSEKVRTLFISCVACVGGLFLICMMAEGIVGRTQVLTSMVRMVRVGVC